MKELFENYLNTYSSWRNEIKKTISVALFNKDGVFIKELKIPPHGHIIVPPNTTLKLSSFIQ